MKIGRYDRAPQMLVQDTKNANGRINWSPSMIENIRSSREKALEIFSSNANPGNGSLSRYWRQEWEKIYPDLNIDWKQVISRYHYHFGAERRDSHEADHEGVRNSLDSDMEEAETREDIRGFRQWTSHMQEDLIIMRNVLLQADPNVDTSSKMFSRQLMSLFKDKHPNCMESERSLLSKLKESSQNNHTIIKEPTPKPKQAKPIKVEAPPPVVRNPAVDIMSDIEGFTDWNLGMVRDFISCMDRARRKYTDMKESDPNMKLVPLLLVEWKTMYPETAETVRTFLVRIRYLKTNKESIKAKLGEHDLLPRMSSDDQPPPTPAGDEANEAVSPEAVDDIKPVVTGEKFVWDANNMMPNVIATRAKAIAKQKREAAHGRRISYAKIWIKEFQKIYPNCPYTANNLSVHYWYWTSRQENHPDKADILKKANESMDVDDEMEIDTNWSGDNIEELRRIGMKVNNMLKDENSFPKNTDSKQFHFSKLLHSVWLNLHPESDISENGLVAVYNKVFSNSFNKLHCKEEPGEQFPSSTPLKEKWTPKHNKCLREIINRLKECDKYTRNNVIKEWNKQFTKLDWEYLSSRIDDCGYNQPVHLVLVKEKKQTEAKKTSSSKAEVKPSADSEATPAGLNARGQMRWTQQAVTDLLQCHKLGLKAKNSHPDKKLADLVHQKFKQRHPYCPIAPNVLLTKCYILR